MDESTQLRHNAGNPRLALRYAKQGGEIVIDRALRLVDEASAKALGERRWTALGSFSERHGCWEKAFVRCQVEGAVRPMLIATLSSLPNGGARPQILLEWSYGAELGQRYIRRAGPSVELNPAEMNSAATAERIRVSAVSASELAETLEPTDLDQTHELPRSLVAGGE